MIHGHGGNVYALARQLGCRVVDIQDMSSNVNPLGPPAELLAHLAQRLEVIRALPEADAGSLIESFGRKFDQPADSIAVGNGTTQLIYDLPRALGSRRVRVAGPTYADYADSCRINGAACRYWMSREGDDFAFDPEAFGAEMADADTVFICNPNNPTGRLIEAEVLRRLCRDHPTVRFIVDESYLPFVPQAEKWSLLISRPANAVVLYAMSKIFRIPGMRVGFALGDSATIQAVKRYALPWSVNSLAIEAVRFLLEQQDVWERFVAHSREWVAAQREDLASGLTQIPQLKIFPSVTSFLLLRLPEGHRAPQICRHLAAHRLLVRDCSNFAGLSDRFVRVSLKTPDINQRCIDLFQRYLHG